MYQQQCGFILYGCRTSQSDKRDKSTNGLGAKRDSVVSSIKNEAETTQQIVDMMSSTETMRKRKNLYSDLTYRSRGAKAKRRLDSCSPSAPHAAQWGSLFDSMVARLRGQSDENYCNNDTECIRSRCSSISADASYQWDELEVDHSALHDRCPSGITCTESQPKLLGTASLGTSRPTSLVKSSNEGFWEENWVTPSGSPEDDILDMTVTDMCNVCKSSRGTIEHSSYSINLCYKNHNCVPSTHKNESLDGNGNKSSGNTANQLSDVTVRRPELGVCSQLPEPPIRKTESST